MKILAATFAESNKFPPEEAARFLLEVDRLKSRGKFSDDKILAYAYKNTLKIISTGEHI